MGEMSIPDADDSGRLLEPFIEQARKRLEGEPDRNMVARVAKDPGYDEWRGAILRPADRPFGATLLGRPPLEHKPIALSMSTILVMLPPAFLAQYSYASGALSEPKFALLLSVIAALTVIAGVTIGISGAREAKKAPAAAWSLPRSRSGGRPDTHRRRDQLHGGEEVHLARHAAAALWDLHAGDTSQTWQTPSMAEWRSRVDLQQEAAETIRTAGALHELRQALGDFPVYLDDEAKAKWKADHAVYQAGLSSLRERVEHQVALKMAVEEIGRQLDTPVDERTALADRIAATIPGNELAIENLAEINTQSTDLMALLNLHLPSIESADSQPQAISSTRVVLPHAEDEVRRADQ